MKTLQRLLGVLGFGAIFFNWWKWIEFLLNLMNAELTTALVGLCITVLWLIGGILFTFFVGAFSLLALFD